MAFFSKKPRCSNRRMISVSDVIDSMEAFNALHAMTPGTGIDNCDIYNHEEKVRWREYIREGVINCGGEPTELDFFEKAFMGTTKRTEATDVYVRYNCDKDFNIFSEDGGVSGGPGQAVTFTMLRSLHAGGGKYSNVAVNGNIYLYESNQWLRITAVDKTVDYAHRVTAVPFSQFYTAEVKAKKKMMFTRVRMVDGYSCSVPSSSLETPGYVAKVTPFRARTDWEFEIEALRPYQNIIQFALGYDNEGNEVDNYEVLQKTLAREEFKYAKNLIFFLGQQIDNPLLIGPGLALRDEKYSGFDGYINTMLYGGGTVQHTDPIIGYDLDADFQALIMQQDAFKQTNEFFIMHGLPWLMGLIAKSEKYFTDSKQLTWETFKRSGLAQEDITKLGISSYKYLNYTLHFKTIPALSDSRSIGNYNMPYMAMMMPGTGLKDSMGNAVSPIEFYDAGGNPETGSYQEIDRDHRKLDAGCEKLSGTITETFNMAVHCPQKHILLYPKFPCN